MKSIEEIQEYLELIESFDCVAVRKAYDDGIDVISFEFNYKDFVLLESNGIIYVRDRFDTNVHVATKIVEFLEIPCKLQPRYIGNDYYWKIEDKETMLEYIMMYFS